ncbi:MAG TPA: hypothetical protein VNV18_08215 [Stellaceae bacterium]|jgi:hypothetical protein|nr:hypothetical protein [Stellaceae bacterium]
MSYIYLLCLLALLCLLGYRASMLWKRRRKARGSETPQERLRKHPLGGAGG